MKYSVHRFDINMAKDQSRLEQFLNRLEGEVVAIIPNIRPKFLLMPQSQAKFHSKSQTFFHS